MPEPHDIDGVLVQWGDRLFYPRNRIVKPGTQPSLKGFARNRAAAIRERITATVVRRAPQVMVKVTGGGRGMKAIAAHFRYITRNGRLEIEDERSQVEQGKAAVRELVEDWRLGGSLIEDVSHRREAFNVMLSMPRGVDALTVQRAAREFAQTELAEHKYVMVLHDHQSNPHVHLSVRADSMHGKRLNPRKADLQRWRETFAEKLRGWGIEAEATRQTTRWKSRNYESLWRIKAREDGRLRSDRPRRMSSRDHVGRASAIEAWSHIG
ncbi:MAG: conjugal transfer protein TraS, partial [Pseudomonadota bacterium]|nr:conjugal transfer protein TraS [Pseudomonadota bacterium]